MASASSYSLEASRRRADSSVGRSRDVREVKNDRKEGAAASSSPSSSSESRRWRDEDGTHEASGCETYDRTVCPSVGGVAVCAGMPGIISAVTLLMVDRSIDGMGEQTESVR